ncbi:uncharacterized protein A1O5_10765 [Cladophialophora psammophila CBS 110553]|uniref:Major facilitator superfamily (MFS) profile domain-containing protein n=1 Tax=Cladophialophora psammophila CBS 110553 TaxID=1182543 RepID=W9X6R6_9EURO|nr:uncharacterized protein A1O5_10765 [Cladophialophora psammophila CBS 110553]EXJ66149.1 hypothetical protein A1O5_10765 [Cladophialophora psammophila CBS 110553]
MTDNKISSVNEEHAESIGEVKKGVIDSMLIDTERSPEARGRLVDDVPRSYWVSGRFLGSYVAVILASNAGIGGFSLAAPVLSAVNNELGPSPNISWIGLSWLLCQGIGALIVGRLSDIFGRRWMFITGSIIGLIGSIFASIAGGIQVNFWWVTSEIVPMKYRYVAVAGCFALAPYNHLGSKIAYSLLTQTGPGWRSIYYLLIATNAASVAAWYSFYHPPTFKMLHRHKAAKDLLTTFDWLGLVLYIGSTITFLMGLQWGGALYPWKSAHVIGALLAGAAGLAIFIGWEIYLPRMSQNIIPFVTLYYLRNFNWLCSTILSGVGGSAYYGFSTIWPSAVSTIYSVPSHSQYSTLLCLVTMSYTYGQATVTLATHWTGPKPLLITCMMISGPILAAVAYNPLNMSLTMGLIIVGCIFIGGMKGIALVTTTFPLRTQEEIGSAGGLSGTIRLFFSCVSLAIYGTTLTNRLATTIPANILPAMADAGLPSSSIPALLSGLSGATALNETTVAGLNPHILSIAQTAYRVANAQAYRTVFLVSLAFTGPGMILVWFTSQNDRAKEDLIAGHIHKRGEERALETQAD